VPEALTKTLAEQIESEKKKNETQPIETLRPRIVNHLSMLCRVGVPAADSQPGATWYRGVLTTIGKSYKVRDVTSLDDQLLTDEVLRAVVRDALDASRKPMQSASSEEQAKMRDKLTDDLYERLSATDVKSQTEFAELFGANEVTRELISRLLRDGTMLGGAWLAANAAGFALYVAATTIVHAVFTTLLGITLSFGTYIALTSFMAALLNPFTAILAGLGLMGGGYAYQKRKLGPRVAALGLMQILGAAPEATNASLADTEDAEPGDPEAPGTD
jgi:ABC-type multidrug transport system fused ATPase/permease subunit